LYASLTLHLEITKYLQDLFIFANVMRWK